MSEKENNSRIVATVSRQSLIQDLRQIIEQARVHVAATANYELTMMYWRIGERINREVLDNKRAEYGKQIVPQVATQLQEEYGKKGFEARSIRRMMQFAQEFFDRKKTVARLTCTKKLRGTRQEPHRWRNQGGSASSLDLFFAILCFNGERYLDNS